MFGNSIIPTRAQHDRRYAHTCIVCGGRFTRGRRPFAEARHAGLWGDACAPCHALLHEGEDGPDPFSPPPPVPSHRPLIARSPAFRRNKHP